MFFTFLHKKTHFVHVYMDSLHSLYISWYVQGVCLQSNYEFVCEFTDFTLFSKPAHLYASPILHRKSELLT